MDLRATFISWSGLPGCCYDNLLGWDVKPFMVDDEPIAIGLLNGREIHFAAKPELRGNVVTRARCAAYLGPLLEEHSFLTTSSMEGTSTAFIRRLGFEPTWTDGDVDHHMLCSVPFARAAKAL